MSDPQFSHQIIDRFRAGDQTAFDELHDRLGPQIFAYVRTRCGCAADAADVSQEVWLKAWRGRERFEKGNFRAWLYAIAKRHLIDEYRKDKRKPTLQALPGDIDFVASEDNTDAAMLKAMKDCIEETHGNFVQVLRMRLDGISTEQIAHDMEIPVGTVYTRASRGKERLRDCIQGKLQ